MLKSQIDEAKKLKHYQVSLAMQWLCKHTCQKIGIKETHMHKTGTIVSQKFIAHENETFHDLHNEVVTQFPEGERLKEIINLIRKELKAHGHTIHRFNQFGIHGQLNEAEQALTYLSIS